MSILAAIATPHRRKSKLTHSGLAESIAEPAFVTIGVDKDRLGQPLITANGCLVGTVDQMKQLIAEYEETLTLSKSRAS